MGNDLQKKGGLPDIFRPESERELILGRWPSYPGWFTNQKFPKGKEFRKESGLQERSGFEADLHAMDRDAGDAVILDFDAMDMIPPFVFDLGDEPRLHYTGKMIDELRRSPKALQKCCEDMAVDQNSRIRLYFMRDNFDRGFPEQTMEFLAELLNALRRESAARDKNVPDVPYAQMLNDFFKPRQLARVVRLMESMMMWGDQTINVFRSKPRMLMDHWQLATQKYPDIGGFRRAAYFFPEEFVAKHGHKIVSLEQAKPVPKLPGPDIG